LLDIGAGVGKGPSHRIQIRLHSVGVGPHPPLFALDEIYLLGMRATNNPTHGNGQKTRMNRFHKRPNTRKRVARINPIMKQVGLE
jgi:hypothetical protein